MADTNIPAWLAALQAQQQPTGGSGWNPGLTYADPTSGTTYRQMLATSSNGGENNDRYLNGYYGSDAAALAADAQGQKSVNQAYDLAGNHTMDFVNDPKDG